MQARLVLRPAGTSAPLEVLQQAQHAALKFAGGLYDLLTSAVAGGGAGTQQAWQPASDFPPLLSKVRGWWSVGK